MTPSTQPRSIRYARHSATIAGAHVVEGILASEPALSGDLLADPAAVERLVGALNALVAYESDIVAA